MIGPPRFSIRPSIETEIYLSEGGYICIRQGDSVVMLHPSQSAIFVDHIYSVADWYFGGGKDTDERGNGLETA